MGTAMVHRTIKVIAEGDSMSVFDISRLDKADKARVEAIINLDERITRLERNVVDLVGLVKDQVELMEKHQEVTAKQQEQVDRLLAIDMAQQRHIKGLERKVYELPDDVSIGDG
jgi:hypothetical protein